MIVDRYICDNCQIEDNVPRGVIPKGWIRESLMLTSDPPQYKQYHYCEECKYTRGDHG